MAAVAVVVVELASGGLLRVEAKLGVGLAALDVAGLTSVKKTTITTETRRHGEIDFKNFMMIAVVAARSRSEVG